jgi:hypothetical protein
MAYQVASCAGVTAGGMKTTSAPVELMWISWARATLRVRSYQVIRTRIAAIRGHSGYEGGEEGEESFAVWRGCAEEVDHWCVPESPEHAEDCCCRKSGETLAQLWVSETCPADFFQESGQEAEGDADPETIWRVDRRYKCFETEENAEDHNRRDEQRRVPAKRETDVAHSGEEIL